jgi:hypothetical protein
LEFGIYLFLEFDIIMEKPYDLEERTFLFARECRIYIQKLPKTISNIEDGKQLVRSSGWFCWCKLY